MGAIIEFLRVSQLPPSYPKPSWVSEQVGQGDPAKRPVSSCYSFASNTPVTSQLIQSKTKVVTKMH